MALSFGRRSSRSDTAPSATPEHSLAVLSPARQALLDHHAKLKALSDQLELLQRPSRELQEAAAALDKAQKDFESIGDLEAQAWRDYVAGGNVGERPAPRVDLRLARQDDINEAKARMAMAEHAVDAVHPAIIETSQAQQALAGQTRTLENAIIAEQIEVLGQQYREAVREAHIAEARLRGLADACRNRQAGGLFFGIGLVINGSLGNTATSDAETIKLQGQITAECQRVRALWRKFGDIVGLNPAGTIDEDES